MATKVYLIGALLLTSILGYSQENRCDNLYSKVTYSLGHSKKAMTATNFEHQMYYAERAFIALDKSKEFQKECGCQKIENKTLDALEVLEKAIEPFDWEAGRFYTKKSIALINELITVIDECTQNDTSPVIVSDSDETTIENKAYKEVSPPIEKQEPKDEMALVFKSHAQARLDSAKKAVEKLVLLSKTYNPHSSTPESPSLINEQKSYLEEAKRILEEGIRALDRK